MLVINNSVGRETFSHTHLPGFRTILCDYGAVFFLSVGHVCALLCDAAPPPSNYIAPKGLNCLHPILLRLFLCHVSRLVGRCCSRLHSRSALALGANNHRSDKKVVRQTFRNDSSISAKIDFTRPVNFLIHGWFGGINGGYQLVPSAAKPTKG